MSTKFIFPRFRSTRTRSTIDHGPRVANAPAPLSVTVPLTYIIMEFSNPTRSSWKFAVPESAEPPPATDCVTPVCRIRWRVLRRNGSSCGELPFAIVSPHKVCVLFVCADVECQFSARLPRSRAEVIELKILEICRMEFIRVNINKVGRRFPIPLRVQSKNKSVFALAHCDDWNSRGTLRAYVRCCAPLAPARQASL